MKRIVGPILITGYGSVGRRHLRNLRALGHNKFVFYRTGKSNLREDEIADIPHEYDLKKALTHKPFATIVANPTSLHMSIANAAAAAGSHLFLEKPISHSLAGVEELGRLVKRKGLIVLVGYQFRFNPGLQKIKHLLDKNAIGRLLSVQAHWGEYLPDWHPWEDYRKSYSAKEALGGGVILTLSHPFDYLRWLIGEVASVSAQTNSVGLGIGVEDSADILLRFTSGVIGNVHLDYLGRPAEHWLRIVGKKGTIFWNNEDGLVKWHSQDLKEFSTPKGFERNDMFVDEMRHFLACITKNEQPFCTLKDGIAAMQIALAAKESARKKKVIKL